MKKCITLLLLFISAIAYSKTGREIIQENNFRSEVAPMLSTAWSQDGGENSMLPIVNGQLAKTGCGATATAQVMKFWNYPSQGRGQNYYIWDTPQGERVVLHADFESTKYDWANMIDQYKNNSNAIQIEIDAVSKLMADLGIALEMKYQNSSTATNIEYISTILKKYFGYNPTMTIHRSANGTYTTEEWMMMVYRELSEGRPIIMGGAYKGANHIYVADGYDSDGNVHLNLGKASIGSSCNIDGYYDLTQTGQTYTEDMRMLIGICPYELVSEIKEFNITQPGTMLDAMGGEMESKKLCRIKITGKINSSDIAYLGELSAITTGQLSYIDLTEADLENNVLPSSAFDTSYTLQEIFLPNSLKKIESKAFRNCTGLWHVQIPSNLSSIDSYAFSNCRYLENVYLPETLELIGNNPFRYDKLTDFSIAETNNNFKISNGALFNSLGTTLFSMPALTIDEYNIDNGVVVIESQAFMKQCMIQSLHFPVSTRQIKSNAFLECIGLKDIYLYSEDPSSIMSDSFDKNILNSCIIHVPHGCKETYESSDWHIFANIIDDIQNSGINDIQSPSSTDIIEIYDVHGTKIPRVSKNGIYLIKHADNSVDKKLIIM